MALNLATTIGKIKMKNPVMVASGTFGYGQEYENFIDPGKPFECASEFYRHIISLLPKTVPDPEGGGSHGAREPPFACPKPVTPDSDAMHKAIRAARASADTLRSYRLGHKLNALTTMVDKVVVKLLTAKDTMRAASFIASCLCDGCEEK